MSLDLNAVLAEIFKHAQPIVQAQLRQALDQFGQQQLQDNLAQAYKAETAQLAGPLSTVHNATADSALAQASADPQKAVQQLGKMLLGVASLAGVKAEQQLRNNFDGDADKSITKRFESMITRAYTTQKELKGTDDKEQQDKIRENQAAGDAADAKVIEEQLAAEFKQIEENLQNEADELLESSKSQDQKAKGLLQLAVKTAIIALALKVAAMALMRLAGAVAGAIPWGSVVAVLLKATASAMQKQSEALFQRAAVFAAMGAAAAVGADRDMLKAVNRMSLAQVNGQHAVQAAEGGGGGGGGGGWSRLNFQPSSYQAQGKAYQAMSDRSFGAGIGAGGGGSRSNTTTTFSATEEMVDEQEMQAEGEPPLVAFPSRSEAQEDQLEQHSKYVVVNHLGRGNFGEAHLVKRRSDGKLFVAKFAEYSRTAEREVQNLSSIHHFAIIGFVEAQRCLSAGKSTLVIVMEYAQRGDLKAELERRAADGRYFTEAELSSMFVPMLLALEHIHSKRMMHRDLKASNFLLMINGLVALADFGLSHTYDVTHTINSERAGATSFDRAYAPEVAGGKPYSKKADMFSLGVVFFEMIALKRPFVARDSRELLKKISTGTLSNSLPEDRGYPPELLSIVTSLLNPDPAARPHMRKILETPLFKRYLAEFEQCIVNSPESIFSSQQKEEIVASLRIAEEARRLAAELTEAQSAANALLGADDNHSSNPPSSASLSLQAGAMPAAAPSSSSLEFGAVIFMESGAANQPWKERYAVMSFDKQALLISKKKDDGKASPLPFASLLKVLPVSPALVDGKEHVIVVLTRDAKQVKLQAGSAAEAAQWIACLNLVVLEVNSLSNSTAISSSNSAHLMSHRDVPSLNARVAAMTEITPSHDRRTTSLSTARNIIASSTEQSSSWADAIAVVCALSSTTAEVADFLRHFPHRFSLSHPDALTTFGKLVRLRMQQDEQQQFSISELADTLISVIHESREIVYLSNAEVEAQQKQQLITAASNAAALIFAPRLAGFPSEVDLSGCVLHDCNLAEADLTTAQFASQEHGCASLFNCDFSWCIIDDNCDEMSPAVQRMLALCSRQTRERRQRQQRDREQQPSHQQQQHTKSVTCIALSPDGTQLATASSDCTAKLWDTVAGECLRTFSGHTGSVTCVVFSPKQQQQQHVIATSSADGTVKMWNAETGACLRTLSGHQRYVRKIAFSPDGKLLASCSLDRTVRLWSSETGELNWVADLSNDNNLLVSRLSFVVGDGNDDDSDDTLYVCGFGSSNANQQPVVFNAETGAHDKNSSAADSSASIASQLSSAAAELVTVAENDNVRQFVRIELKDSGRNQGSEKVKWNLFVR